MKLNDRQRQALTLVAAHLDRSGESHADPQRLETEIAAGIHRGYAGLARTLLTQLGGKGAIRFRWIGDGFRVELLPAGRDALAAR
jgi:hypothetical protein